MLAARATVAIARMARFALMAIDSRRLGEVLSWVTREGSASVSPVETLLKQLPPDLRREAEDFILFLVRRHESAEREVTRSPAWPAFLSQTYGSMADAPIQRQPQGRFEVRPHFT